MKLVIGIVRPEQANEVLEALYRAEVRGFSISRVQGHGGELDRVETYRGTTVKMGLSEKVRFEVAVSDCFVDRTVEALCEGGRTGEVGDGKIFVAAAGAGGPDPHRRHRRGRRDAGGEMMIAAVDTGDTAWMLVATALVLLMTPALGPLLRRAGALEEHPQHLHDVRRRDRDRDRHLGRGRLLARLRRRRRR